MLTVQMLQTIIIIQMEPILLTLHQIINGEDSVGMQ